jgi:hypothetical protein
MGKKTKRRRKLTRHHIKNVCNGGTDTPNNIILLKNNKHQCWHEIFGNKSFKQAARVLLRASRMIERREI